MNNGNEAQQRLNFSNYPECNYAVSIFSLWTSIPEFSTNTISRDELLQTLDFFKTRLILKNEIDFYILKRKNENKKNKLALVKLYELYRRINDSEVQQELNEIVEAFNIHSQNNQQALPDTEIISKINQSISSTNNHRLDGVWSRNIFGTMKYLGIYQLDTLDTLMGHIRFLNNITSYGFYFVRGGLEGLKLISHVFDNASQYQEVSFWTKFKVQWSLRFPTIINDLILWGPVNLACAHFLGDQPSNILTSMLLLGDFIHGFAIQYIESKKQDIFLNLPDNIKNKFNQLKRQDLYKLYTLVAYQFFLFLGFSLIPLSFYVSYPNDYLLKGAIACLSLQFINNQREFIVDLINSQDRKSFFRISAQMISRFLLQALIPLCFFITANLFMPSLLVSTPAWFITCSLLSLSTMLVNLCNDFNQWLANWLNPAQQGIQLIEQKAREVRDTIIQLKENVPETNQALINLKKFELDNLKNSYEEKRDVHQHLIQNVLDHILYPCASVITLGIVGLSVSPLLKVAFALASVSAILSKNHQIEKTPSPIFQI